MSVTSADQVISDTVQAAEAEFGPAIEAIFLMGSLAHGGFAPLVSDVDVAIILSATSLATADRIGQVQRRVQERASSPLSERLSVFWGDWNAVRSGESAHMRLGPVDRLDLLDSGRLLKGSDHREPSVRPSREDLVVMSADHILTRFTDDYLGRLADNEALVAAGPRAVTKAILFPVRFMYTLREGRIGLNDASAHWYVSQELPGWELASKAILWRNAGLEDRNEVVPLLDADLAPLHAACLREYARELDALGEPERAADLTARTPRIPKGALPCPTHR